MLQQCYLLAIIQEPGYPETPGSLPANMDDVLGSTDGESDLRICCGACELRAHKSIIYPHLELFTLVREDNSPVSLLALRN